MQSLLATVGTCIWLGTGIWGQVCGKPIILMNSKWSLLMNTGLPVDCIFRATCRDTKPSRFATASQEGGACSAPLQTHTRLYSGASNLHIQEVITFKDQQTSQRTTHEAATPVVTRVPKLSNLWKHNLHLGKGLW